MATRATYQIGATTFYCHWDGYPTGAACRFANMVAAATVAATDGIDAIECRRGGMAFAFIRGNMDAEPTESHEAHGDTEYRYTLKSGDGGALNIRVEGRRYDGPWTVQHYGDLADWLNLQRGELVKMLQRLAAREQRSDHDAEAQALEAIPVMVRVNETREYCPHPFVTYATVENAGKIEHRYDALAARFQADNPNRRINAAAAAAWRQAIEATIPKADNVVYPEGWQTAG